MWIDSYLGPPNQLVYNTGTNFASIELRNKVRLIDITCKQVSIKAYQSVGKVERYYRLLYYAFKILYAKLSRLFTDKAILQIAVKAVNNTARLDRLVPILLIFSAFPQMNTDLPLFQLILKRAKAIAKAIKALQKAAAERQLNAVLYSHNGPNVTYQLMLLL